MKQEILFILLKDFADWEGVYITASMIFPPIMPESSTYWINNGFAKDDKFLNLL